MFCKLTPFLQRCWQAKRQIRLASVSREHYTSLSAVISQENGPSFVWTQGVVFRPWTSAAAHRVTDPFPSILAAWAAICTKPGSTFEKLSLHLVIGSSQNLNSRVCSKGRRESNGGEGGVCVQKHRVLVFLKRYNLGKVGRVKKTPLFACPCYSFLIFHLSPLLFKLET